MKNDIVITGMGIVSPLGLGKAAFWKRCLQARTGIQPVQPILGSDYRCTMAAMVENFNPRQYLKPAVYRRMSRLSRMTAGACIEAVEDSGLDLNAAGKDRVAMVAGTTHGSSDSIESFYASMLAEGPRGAQPFYFPETVPNAPAGHVAIILGITGPNTTFGQNDISAENALVYARQLILEDQVDAAIVCGMDEICGMVFGCYDALGIMNRGIEGSDAQPLTGGGIVLGEGAGALVLERESFARKRKARILAVLESGTVTGGPTPPGTYENCDLALADAIGATLEHAGIQPSQVDQVCTSGNLSGHAEQVEYDALTRTGALPEAGMGVSPIRYLIGNFGGAGIFSAAALTLSLHFQHRLPYIESRTYTATGREPQWRSGQKAVTRHGLMTACSYGGGCAALVLGAYDKSH